MQSAHVTGAAGPGIAGPMSVFFEERIHSFLTWYRSDYQPACHGKNVTFLVGTT